jgi:CheY-like chemotaxis protein
VVSAKNGEEGVELFKAHTNDIKLILLDVVMPIMDGAECLALLRELSNDVPIALSSGFTKDASIEKLLEYDNTFFIKKPYTLAELYDCIEEMTRDDQDN